MFRKIQDGFKYWKNSTHWLLITCLLIIATSLSIYFIYHSDAQNASISNLVNTITIITTALAAFLLFSDFHRSWRNSRDKRLTALFYQTSDANKRPAIMFYYRATLGGESDIRALTQQLGQEIILLGIGKNKSKLITYLGLNTASNHYQQMPSILKDEKNVMVQDYLSIAALYDWVGKACDKNSCVEEKALMQKGMEEQKLFFAQGDSNESEWGFKTWDEIAKIIDPKIKETIENYGKENKLLQFNQE